MSIREALERVPKEAESSEAQRLKKMWSLGEKRRSFESSYKEKVLEAGRAIHREAGVPELLKQLAEIIRPDFPDVKIGKGLASDGMVSLSIDWNFRDELDNRYNRVNVVAYPLTSGLAVMGGVELVVLDKSKWISDPKLLEDAIVRAYRNPISRVGSPARTE